jgi:tetratricopeptide (TPR) repeat protein
MLALLVCQVHEGRGEVALAAQAAEQMGSNRIGRFVRAGLAVKTGNPQLAVQLSERITNIDDMATLELVNRAAAMRELGENAAALEVLKEAVRYPSRAAGARHRARFERALVYRTLGQIAKARAELERIHAEDGTFTGLSEALASLPAR